MASKLEVQRNLRFSIPYKPNLSAYEITLPDPLPFKSQNFYTHICLDVDIFVRSTDIYNRGYVSDDSIVFKRGSKVIRIRFADYGVLTSSSLVSRVISEPKEVGSFDEIRLPIWGVTADGLANHC